MQALTDKIKIVERKPMTFGERLYLPAILKGMMITFSHLFKKRPTINYPEQKRYFPPVWRGLQILNRDEEGRERCTARSEERRVGKEWRGGRWRDDERERE